MTTMIWYWIVAIVSATLSAIVMACCAVAGKEKKHGLWIEKQAAIPWCEDDVEVFWECSVCQCQNIGKSPYCPNCGAKMDARDRVEKRSEEEKCG